MLKEKVENNKYCICLLFKGFQYSRSMRVKVRQELIDKAIAELDIILIELNIKEESEYLKIPISEDYICIYLSFPDHKAKLIEKIIKSTKINCQIRDNAPTNVIKNYRAAQKIKEEARSSFKIGDIVTILSGDYKDCSAAVSSIDNVNKQVRVQIKIFSNTFYVEKLPFSDIVKEEE